MPALVPSRGEIQFLLNKGMMVLLLPNRASGLRLDITSSGEQVKMGMSIQAKGVA